MNAEELARAFGVLALSGGVLAVWRLVVYILKRN
jgi:hypothetical protein